ncbi:ABC-F family ATP-binding cassette domain-containing protein [Caldalkalibacillus salinus]|uniref:ABC-F family ATP-binding cassette domain-containing protein n=1 Tax=Caldalkalibacillus salinus TaxID=2803787 RepID=UPI0019234CEC|nr:ABC-F type ribosomal protection protein [Caldalkalibacillus salinus]
MIILQAHQISKSYGTTPILHNINLEVRTGERIGLVGVNGAGKSTLLKIIVGDLSPDEGEIMKGRDYTVGYLAQNSGLNSQASIWDEMIKVFAPLIKQERKLRDIEARLAQQEVLQDEDTYEPLLAEYSRLSDTFKDQGGYQYEAQVRTVLHGFRFGDKDYNTPISSLSGGQKTRLALAKLLLQSPDLLILDEPTNYLDLETLAWLEQYLLHYPGGILIVSHDRYFLDALVNVVYEIERHKATKYIGNYTEFLEQKAAIYEQQVKQFRKQQKEIARMEDFVQRNIARASTTKRAQSRRKALEKMDRMEQPDGDLKRASFSFDIDRQSGNDVLNVKDVTIGYEGVSLSQGISFHAYRGDAIAIVGPNGVGKTTLLKTMIDSLPPIAGHILKGTNVSIAYYDQEQRRLNPKKTLLHEIWDDYPHMLEKDVRSLLGQFLFSGEDVDKLVQDLSGGEKARLSLAKLMLQKANVLVLDEPTNHLDIYSKEVLEQSLIHYPGTILFVSHDRYFINRIANKVVELHTQGATTYLGDYDYYVYKKEEQEQIEALDEQKQKNKPQEDTTSSAKPENPTDENEASDKAKYELNKQRQRIERQFERKRSALEEKMTKVEERINELEQEMCLPEVYEDYEAAQKVQNELDALNEELNTYFEEWSELEEERDATLS